MFATCLSAISRNCRAHLDPTGNWCNHDPENPVFFTPPKEHGKRPWPIIIAQKNAEKFYEEPKRWLSPLQKARLSCRQRQERTEGRERDIAVIQSILHYIELSTLRVGVPCDDGSFNSLDMRFIAEKCGFREKGDHPDKGLKRLQRSFALFKSAGYINVHYRKEKYGEGQEDYRELVSVKSVSPRLFHHLGVSNLRLEKARKHAKKQLDKKRKQATKESATRMKDLFFEMLGAEEGARKIEKGALDDLLFDRAINSKSNIKARGIISHESTKAEKKRLESEARVKKADIAKAMELYEQMRKKNPNISLTDILKLVQQKE